MQTELRRARNRQMAIFLLVCASMTVLLGRLYYWQITQAQSGYRLADLANAEHTQNQIVDAPRGLIYDDLGHLLATNVVRDDVYIEPLQFSAEHADNYEADLASQVQALHRVFPKLSVETLSRAFKANLQTVRIAQEIDPGQSQQLQEMHLPDTFLQPRTWRSYPADALAGQILGYVSNGKGIYGIEQKYNTLLSGKAGSFSAETDLNGNPLTVGASSDQPAVPGADLTLTIDSFIQYQMQQELADEVQRMKAQGGTAVVVNVQTGAIVAMAGVPDFNPNHYGDYADQSGCLGSEAVYYNPALFCAYEPGSIMKPITMAVALDQKVVTPDTTIDDPGCVTYPGTSMVCNDLDKGYGQESMTQVLEHSANVGAAYAALQLGSDRYYPYLAKFGFGQKTGLFGPEEAGTYRTNTSADWSKSDLTRQAFGQSILATPLQMAMAYQAIANGGVMMQPYIVASVNDNGHVSKTQPKVQRRVVSAETAKMLTGMLMHVATYNNQVASVPGYSLAYKTGTATTQGLADTVTEGSVAGFLPASHPRFVILVKIDRPTVNIYGGIAAGPPWQHIAQQLMLHYGIQPDQQ